METSIEEVSSVVRKIRLTIPYERVRKELDLIYNKVKNDLVIPGFRRGKAPKHVAEMKMGQELKDEVVRTFVPQALKEAWIEQKIHPVAAPIVTCSEIKKDNPLVIEATVEVLPEFEVADYKGMNISAVEAEPVTDDDIEQTLKDLQRQYATQAPVEGRPVAKGDIVVVDFLHIVDGEEHSEKGHTCKLDEGVMPDFVENVVGMVPGETRKFEIVLGDNYYKKEYAGKTAKYILELKEIKSEVLPDLDDDFAKEAGECDTMKALRVRIRERLERYREDWARLEERKQIMGALLEQYKLEVPNSLVDQQTEYNLRRKVEEAASMGLPEEIVEQHKEQIIESAEKSSKNQIALYLILDKIAQKESISVSEEELNNRFDEMARERELKTEQTKEYLKKKGYLEEIKEKMLYKKVMDFLYESAARRPAEKMKARKHRKGLFKHRKGLFHGDRTNGN